VGGVGAWHPIPLPPTKKTSTNARQARENRIVAVIKA